MVTKIKLKDGSIHCLLLLSALLASNWVVAQSILYDLNIPAQNTAKALNFLATETGETFLFSYDLAEKSQSKALQGQYDLKTALNKLLAGTGLVTNITDSGALVITSPKEADETINNERNHMNNKRGFLVSSLAALFTLNATAEETTANTQVRKIEEVIVTAQKREQSINDVGLSISAADADQLANAGIYDVAGLAKIVPGMTASSSLMGSPTITLRGIGFNGFTLGSSPAVSVYVDQTPLPFNQMARGTTLDLERVEVLKGPQGILFGQNSTGGAVNYIAAKPTEEFEAGVSLTYGRFNESHVEGFVSGAVSGNLNARLAIRTDQGGAWQENFTRDDELGDKDFTTFRLLLDWQLNDKTSVAFNLNGWKDKSDSQAPQFQEPRLQTTGNARGVIINNNPKTPNNARSANWSQAFENAHDDDYLQASIRGDIEINDELTFTSITSYDNYNQDFSLDRDGTTLELIDILSNAGEIKDFSQEFRLAGNNELVHWVVGVNHLSASTINSTLIGIGDSTNTVVPTNATFGNWTRATQNGAHEISEYAVFGNIDFSLSESLTLSAGLRYTDSEKDFEGCTTGDASITALQSLVSTGFANPLLITPGDCVTLDPAQSFAPTLVKTTLAEDNVSWRLGLNFEPNENTLLYTNIAKGFKSGSFPVLSAPNAIQLDPVTQEEVLAYEAGFKSTLAETSIQFNGAVFYYDYKDKQVRGNVVAPPFGVLEKLVNVPESHVKGAEIQLLALPIDGLTTSFSATYLDTEIDKFIGLDGSGATINLAGSIIPFTPKLQMVGDAEYRFAASDTLDVFVGGSFTHNSDTNSNIGEPVNGDIDDFLVFDGRAGVASNDGKWQLMVWGRNITNEYYWNNNFASQDVEVRFAAKPVTYGLTLDYSL